MDTLKIKSKFMRTVVSKLIGVALKKKFGYKVKIQINDIDVVTNDDITHVHLNVDAEMNNCDFVKVTRFIEDEE